MNLIQTGLIIASALPIVATALLAYQLQRNGQGIMGKPTIGAWLFYPSKFIIAVIISLTFAASLDTQFFRFIPGLIQNEIPDVQKIMGILFLLGANLLLIPAYYSMSIFTRVGLPTTPHALQTTGVYRISRNPMYTSFFFFHTACFLLIPSLLLAVFMIFNLATHHLIILKEERYLTSHFSDQYLTYKKNTARYL